MRVLLFILLASGMCFSQSSQEKIISFINDNVGNKVGNGVCFSLIEEAYKDICHCDMKKGNFITGYSYRLGPMVSQDSVKSGDFVIFDFYDKETGKHISSHIGFVYGVSDTNLSVAHQNYYNNGHKIQTVTITQLKEFFDEGTITVVKFYQSF